MADIAESPSPLKPSAVDHCIGALRHPLTIVVVGFVLSGIVGVRLTSSIQQHQAETERDVRHYETSTTAIVAFSNSIYKRYVRAGLLKSALSRNASPEEVKHRKELYDEALADQESTILGYHLLIREALKEQDYDDFERYYQYALKPRLDLLDRVLTESVDEYLRTHSDQGVKLACANKVYAQVVVCNSAITNSVFRSVSSKRYLSGQQVVDTEQKAKTDLAVGCPMWAPAQSPPECDQNNGRKPGSRR
jgi:hypothetical protein